MIYQEKPERPLEIAVLEKPDPECLWSVERIINDYNLSVMHSDYRPLMIVLKKAGGQVVGGLNGKTEWGWLTIATLAIREEYRGQGYGTRLLARAEDEARARGCHSACLDTFSFQARPFYEKHGYRVFGELEGYSAHTRFFMRKRLAPASEPPGGEARDHGGEHAASS